MQIRLPNGQCLKNSFPTSTHLLSVRAYIQSEHAPCADGYFSLIQVRRTCTTVKLTLYSYISVNRLPPSGTTYRPRSDHSSHS
ncbi:MAG: hypothetical protein HC912_08115, partial [Saprospiraceae bacterium]|nr:hypothetical protein [Saprospiraceae bacterium]